MKKYIFIKKFLFKIKNFLLPTLFLLLFLIFNINTTSIKIGGNEEKFKTTQIKTLQEKLNQYKKEIKIFERQSNFNFYTEKYFKLGKYYYFLDNLNVIYKATTFSPIKNNKIPFWFHIYEKTNNILFLLQDKKIIKNTNATEFYKTHLTNFFDKIKSKEDNLKTDIESQKIISAKKWNINFNIKLKNYSKTKVLNFLKNNLKQYFKETKEKTKTINFNEKENLLYMYFSPQKKDNKKASFAWFQDKAKVEQIVYKLISSRKKVISINCFGINFKDLNIAIEKNNLELLNVKTKKTFATWKIILILLGVLVFIIIIVYWKFKDSSW